MTLSYFFELFFELFLNLLLFLRVCCLFLKIINDASTYLPEDDVREAKLRSFEFEFETTLI